MCKARWVECMDFFSTFLELFQFILLTIEGIAMRMIMLLGIGILKHIRKLLGCCFFLFFFYVKCLPLIFKISISIIMRLLSTLRSVAVKLQHWSGYH